MVHEKKEKGDIGTAKCLADMTEQGWKVCLPLTEHAKYDFIAENDGDMLRVQCRYSKMTNGSIHVKLRSVWSDKHGVHRRSRKIGDFDILAIYCPDTRECYYLHDTQFICTNSVTIRVHKAANKQSKGVRYSNDYRTVTAKSLDISS